MTRFLPLSRQRQLLRLILRLGPLSRAQLHAQSGIRKMTVHADADELVSAGLLREGPLRHLPRGRPEVPMIIDPTSRDVIGVAIDRAGVELRPLNLCGEPLGPPQVRTHKKPHAVLEAAAEILSGLVSDKTLAIGLSVPGFVDPIARTILLSAALPGQHAVGLHPLYVAAGDVPVVLENDLHALAAHWLLKAQREPTEDVLMVYIGDGQLGAALLINGCPNRGCVSGANELGHTRLGVDTAPCYCGHSGCLERIVSTEFLQGLNAHHTTLADSIAAFDGRDEHLNRILNLLALGLANGVNFVRPARLVLVSPFIRHAVFTDLLLAALRREMLSEIARRVRIDTWDQALPRSAANAGALALATLFLDDWQPRSGRSLPSDAGQDDK